MAVGYDEGSIIIKVCAPTDSNICSLVVFRSRMTFNVYPNNEMSRKMTLCLITEADIFMNPAALALEGLSA